MTSPFEEEPVVRKRKLVKLPERPVESVSSPPPPSLAPAPEPAPKRRRLVKKGEPPAVAQFAGYPEAQARVRKALETMPHLAPTAFSWSPIRMGGPLCGAEAARVSCKRSIRVPGLWMDGFKKAVCSDCYTLASLEGLLIGGGWAITLYQPAHDEEQTRFKCLRCGKVFHGERY